MYQHYLVTRFNLINQKWVSHDSTPKAININWLTQRFELFEKYCFHSINSQSNKNFEWLIYFDIHTPHQFKATIDRYSELCPQLKPLFIDGIDHFMPSLKNYIKENCSEKFCITTRLDNDDSIHENFVHEIQKIFNHQTYIAVDVVDGFSLQKTKVYRLGQVRNFNNSFMSLIEKSENPDTVWKYKHAHWKYESRVFRIKNKRLWVRIIHDDNLVNWFGGYGNIDLKQMDPFHFPDDVMNEMEKYFEPASKRWLINIRNMVRNRFKSSFLSLKLRLGYYRLKKSIS